MTAGARKSAPGPVLKVALAGVSAFPARSLAPAVTETVTVAFDGKKPLGTIVRSVPVPLSEKLNAGTACPPTATCKVSERRLMGFMASLKAIRIEALVPEMLPLGGETPETVGGTVSAVAELVKLRLTAPLSAVPPASRTPVPITSV